MAQADENNAMRDNFLNKNTKYMILDFAMDLIHIDFNEKLLFSSCAANNLL